MYGINDYKKETKGLKKNTKLYRGLTMSYINLSFYMKEMSIILLHFLL